jgi:Tol biopolymer transport system component
MTEPSDDVVIDLRSVVPEPPDDLLDWPGIERRYRRRRARRAAVAVVSCVAIVAGVVIGSVEISRTGSHSPSTATSHRNGPLVFVQKRAGADDLVETDADGANVRTIARNVGRDAVALSPNGRELAYFTGPSLTSLYGELRLLEIGGDGTPAIVQCSEATACYDLAWSPDSRQLAFGDDGLRVVNLRGKATMACGTRCGITVGDLTWSPDGTRIAFAQSLLAFGIGLNGPTPTRPSPISVIEADGTGLRQLTNVGCQKRRDCTADSSPSWSPDGDQLAFARTPAGVSGGSRRPGVYIVDAAGGKPLVPVRACRRCNATAVRWSPGGRALAILTDSSLPNVLVVTPSGRRLAAIRPTVPGRRISREDDTSEVTWSPDDSALEMLVRRGASTVLYVARADGSELRQLSVGQLEGDSPLLDWLSAPT